MKTLRGDKIAVIGDMHGQFDALDVEFFSGCGYDLLLFVGDLGSGTLQNGLSVIRDMARVEAAGLVLPGNNDAEHLAELSAELAHQSGAGALMRLAGVQSASSLEPCGYSNHLLRTEQGLVTLITARPCAMGGSEFTFAEQLERNYGVGSIEASVARLRELVDQANTEALVFMAHNGPFGLGGEEEDPWARDFPLPSSDGVEPPTDWGDRDLSDAVAYAKAKGKRVLAVIAGHMHRRKGDKRPLSVVRDGTVYVNPAASPRIVDGEDGPLHHFVDLRLSPKAPSAEERVVVVERWVSL